MEIRPRLRPGNGSLFFPEPPSDLLLRETEFFAEVLEPDGMRGLGGEPICEELDDSGKGRLQILVNFVGTFTVAVRVVRDDAEAFVRLPSNGEVVVGQEHVQRPDPVFDEGLVERDPRARKRFQDRKAKT